MLNQSESPIEFDMLNAILSVCDCLDVRPDASLEELRNRSSADRNKVFIRAQVPAGRYRLDIVLAYRGKVEAIECDGHQFHKANYEQMARDAKRDRWLRENHDLSVTRISGKSIMRDPYKAAYQVLHDLTGIDFRAERSGSMPLTMLSIVTAAGRSYCER